MKALLGAAVAALAFATPANAAAEPVCVQMTLDSRLCVPQLSQVLRYLVADADCSVDVGYCEPGAGCKVNVGYCSASGDCAVNVGYCDDTDLPVGL